MTWWIALSLLPVAWILQNTLHELAHLATATLYGYRATGLYPLWHWADGQGRWWLWYPGRKVPSAARFYFARFTVGAPTTVVLAPWGRHHQIHSSPMRWAMPEALAYLIPLLAWGPGWYLLWALCPIGDFTWWWYGFFFGKPHCDGKRWRYGDSNGD